MTKQKAAEKGWPADKVERWPIERLRPRPNNPRTHTAEQVEQIAASMREWGWTNPVLADEDGELIAGHGRVLAAQVLGLKEVPVMVARGWSPAQIRAYVIADNKLALNAGWNDDVLRAELKELEAADFEMATIGFAEHELDDLFGQAKDADEEPKEEDAAPAIAKRAITKPGDIWLCGPHRVMCGDARSEETLAALMAG